MGLLDDVIANDAVMAFSAPDIAFEVETITYKPRVGSEHSFSAQVWRFPPEPLDDLDGGMARRIEIFIPRSATAAVGRTVITTQVDNISVAWEKNGEAKDHPVVSVLSEDAGGFMVRLL